jgi:CheY-specific phosphatase CheX
MHKNLIDYCTQSGYEIIASVLNATPTTQNPTDITSEYKVSNITCSVILNGDIQGKLVINTNRETAQKVAIQYFKEDIEDNNDQLLQSVIKELTNMIAGKVISLYSFHDYNVQLSAPKIHDLNETFSFIEFYGVQEVKFNTIHGAISMIVNMKEKK